MLKLQYAFKWARTLFKKAKKEIYQQDKENGFKTKKEAKQEFSDVEDSIIDVIFEELLLLDLNTCKKLLLDYKN